MLQQKLPGAALCLVTLTMGIVFYLAPAACADFYKYTDSTGAVCITNDRNAVPPKYRAAMKVVRDEVPEKRAPTVRNQAPEVPLTSRESVGAPIEQKPIQAPAAASRFESLTERYPWGKPLLIVAGVLLLFLLVVKVCSLLSSPQLSRVIYLVFFLGVFVYGYKLYADSLLDNYRTTKTKILTMFVKANERQAPELGEKSDKPQAKLLKEE